MFFSDTLPALWYFLHALCFNEFLAQLPPHFQRYSIAVMAHGSSSDRLGQGLVSALAGGILQCFAEPGDLNCSLFDELIKVEISFVHQALILVLIYNRSM